ncbi:MAG: sigma-54-dependent Fis family transcriptional regulator [Alphaproteobacteria bacterium]|nr:sigma-54-dependent Fis family transcriptional regulator [Alphaproteobacteria bacterium]
MPRANLTRPDLHPHDFHGLVTVSPKMLELFELIRRAARSNATVLVRGESGTGKELVATAIHQASPRHKHPFRAVNCATFTPELLASELFGHVRGAFTGAVRDKAGVFAQADQGTLFLDEVAELPLELQARLLRVLQQKRFVPVGATSEVEVDVRVVSATNAALRKLVGEGRFREDLMYRIRVVVLYLPRLAEREGDLEALAWHFIDRFNAEGLRRVHAIDRTAWEAMRAYSWPGNIRELRNNIEQAFVLGEGPVLRLEELAPELVAGEEPVHAPDHTGHVDAPAAPATPTLEDIQRDQLVAAIRATGGRREEMAERLGISRSTLYRRLKHFGLT